MVITIAILSLVPPRNPLVEHMHHAEELSLLHLRMSEGGTFFDANLVLCDTVAKQSPHRCFLCRHPAHHDSQSQCARRSCKSWLLRPNSVGAREAKVHMLGPCFN